MGCGSSKDKPTEGTELRPPTAQRRQGATSSHVPQSRLGPGTTTSQRAPGATASRGHTREGTARGSSSRQRDLSTAQRQERQQRRRSRIPDTIAETEDRVIHHGLNSLATMINQHCLNFYGANSAPTSRLIGRGIIDDAIVRGVDAKSVAADLSSRLLQYASGQSEAGRGAHLLRLCEDAVGVRRSIDNHPSAWTFGSWDAGVRFPSVLRDGQEVFFFFFS
ncbi:hypothetical protein AOQ84DRAFT_438143 [Glonium stellatum]|uniref:Uncharacterized protein n=1 Tax=Glonium stellatum TaxID=574774 RepID=A0A8E2F6A2_9PEZI|nr:hypothetical protein AOQ84DRAFT_438143 [Glonium stellatum]